MKITSLQIQSFKSANTPQQSISLPTPERNYCLFNQQRVDEIVSQREKALPMLKETLRTSNDEKEIVETLYIIDRMTDAGVKGIPAMYPDLARFNNTQSANVQTFLAGIYRKTQVPDAFGPLVSMLIKNSTKNNDGGIAIPPYKPDSKLCKNAPAQFDPNEEIGGAILEYIRNYSQGPKKIDYSA